MGTGVHQTVLIVEDEDAILRMLAHVVERVGGVAYLASNARAEKNSDRADWLHAARFGVMTHFLHDWIMHDQHDQMTPENWNKLVDGFDVEAVAVGKVYQGRVRELWPKVCVSCHEFSQCARFHAR